MWQIMTLDITLRYQKCKIVMLLARMYKHIGSVSLYISVCALLLNRSATDRLLPVKVLVMESADLILYLVWESLPC
jgi:hypothetical protein